jgi:hypothetical protein
VGIDVDDMRQRTVRGEEQSGQRAAALVDAFLDRIAGGRRATDQPGGGRADRP